MARDSPAATFPLPSSANQIASSDPQGIRPNGVAKLSGDELHAFYYIPLLASNTEGPARFGSGCYVLRAIAAVRRR